MTVITQFKDEYICFFLRIHKNWIPETSSHASGPKDADILNVITVSSRWNACVRPHVLRTQLGKYKTPSIIHICNRNIHEARIIAFRRLCGNVVIDCPLVQHRSIGWLTMVWTFLTIIFIFLIKQIKHDKVYTENLKTLFLRCGAL